MMNYLFRSGWPELFLVIAIIVVPANSITEKVGRCPRVIRDTKLCNGQLDQCTTNDDCNGESICCSTGCNKVCQLPSFTACDHANYFFKTQVKLLKAGESLGSLVAPNCTESGAFEEIQCNETTDICWCVDSSGFEKAGTRANSREGVNCSRNHDRCSGPQCRMLCPYGFELDSNGCEICLCKDICKGVKCPGSLECQLQEVSCATEPCPPVPTCKKPRTLDSLCSIGTPFTISESGNLFLCGTSPGKPSCPPGFNCNVQSGNDYGVCCGTDSFYEKPGLCPIVSTSSNCDVSADDSQCQSSCKNDLECPEMKKCCMTESRGKHCEDALDATLCLQQKKIAEILSTKEIEGRGYVPQCDSNGNFLTKQCSRNTKICWCVDSSGRNILHSLAPAHLVNCSNIQIPRHRDLVHGDLTSSQGGCDVQLCSNTCEFGYKADEVTGCDTCDCVVDPCQSLKCPLGTKCSYTASQSCQNSTECQQMIPICLPNILNVNPCDNGQPLVDHSSNQLVVCSENGATCPTSHVCVKASVNSDGLCCLNLPRLESTKVGMCPFIASAQCNSTEAESAQCRSDKDCEGDMKCCAWACGATCADPSLDAQTETNKLPTMCQYLENVERKQNAVLRNFKLAMTVPKCKSTGEFDEIQCSANSCFCADEFGMEISTTRVSKTQNNLTREFCLEKRRLPSCLDMTCRLGCDYGYKKKDNCRICECVNPCDENRLCDEDHYCEIVDMDCSEGYCPAVPYCIPRMYANIAISQQISREAAICPQGVPYFDQELNTSLTCRPRARMLQCPDDYFCHELDENHDFGNCCPIFEQLTDESSSSAKEVDRTPVVSSGNILEDFPTQRKTSVTACELSRERQMELVLQNQRVTYIPRCNSETGTWEPVQCIDEVNRCWCVNSAGITLPGTLTTGKPTCNFRQSRGKFLGTPASKVDETACSEGQTVHVCNKSLCDDQICMTNPTATCGINPCDGCRVQFYDENNNVVDCFAGLGKCQRELQTIINSKAWINQQKQSRHGQEDDDIPESLEQIIDEVLQERLGRAISNSGSSQFPTVGELVAEVMKQSQNSFETFGDKVTELLVRNPLSSSSDKGKVSATVATQAPPNTKFMESLSTNVAASTNAFSTIHSSAIPMLMQKAACPQPTPNEILFRLTGSCIDLCNYDDECGHDERCCLVDCGYRCKQVAVEFQVKVTQLKGNDKENQSFESNLGNDPEEANMVLNVPSCRSNGEYERLQSQGDLMWCVDAQGIPEAGSFTRGHLECSEEGKIARQTATQPICPNLDAAPMICHDQCMKASCKEHPEAICVADPCNSCKVAFFTVSGEKVVCEDKCRQEVDTGLCRASFTRYFYNTTNNKCEEFYWGGCGGNDNNFETMEECHNSCGTEVDRCSSPMQTKSNCKEKTERWYFNSESEACEKFIACASETGNNFPSLIHCQSRCPNRVLCPNIIEGGLNICNRAEACRNLTLDCPKLNSNQVICNVEPCSCTAELKYLDGTTAKCDQFVSIEQETSDSIESSARTELPQQDDPAGRSFELDANIGLIPSQTENILSTSSDLLVIRNGLLDIKPRCFVMKEKYFSKCDAQGNFAPTQCSIDEPVCWCVDSIGNQLEGTSTFLAGSTFCPTVLIQKVNVRLSFPIASPEEVSTSQLGTEMQDLLRTIQAKLVDDKLSVEEKDGLLTVEFVLEGQSAGTTSHVLEEALRRSLIGISVQNQVTLAELSSSRFHYVVPKDDRPGDTLTEEVTTTPWPEEVNISENKVESYVGERDSDDGVTSQEVTPTHEEMNVVVIVLTIVAAITAVLIVIGLFLGLQDTKRISKQPKSKFRAIAFTSPFGLREKRDFEEPKF